MHMNIMEIKIIESTKDRAVFELIGADHTLANVLKERISQDKDVSVCAYNVEHPLISNPKFVIEAKSPKKAIESAIDSLKKDLSGLSKDAQKA